MSTHSVYTDVQHDLKPPFGLGAMPLVHPYVAQTAGTFKTEPSKRTVDRGEVPLTFAPFV